jgi:hypothetical protein
VCKYLVRLGLQTYAVIEIIYAINCKNIMFRSRDAKAPAACLQGTK